MGISRLKRYLLSMLIVLHSISTQAQGPKPSNNTNTSLNQDATDEQIWQRALNSRAQTRQLELELLRANVVRAESSQGTGSQEALDALRSLARRLSRDAAPVKRPLQVDPAVQIELIETLRRMVAAARQHHVGDDVKLAYELDEVARYFIAAGMGTKAQVHLEEALQLLVRNGDPDPTRRQQILERLAGHYQNTGQFERALPILELGVELNSKNDATQLPVARGMMTLALRYLDKQHFEEAEIVAARSAFLFEHQDGAHSQWLALALMYQGKAQEKAGRHKQAISSLVRAQSLLEMHHPHAKAQLATVAGQLADAYEGLGLYELMLHQCERCLTLAMGAQQVDANDIASRQAKLVRCLVTAGQYEKALPIALKVLAFAEESQPPNAIHIAAALGNLGLVYDELGQYGQALDVLQRALALYAAHPGSDSNVARTIGLIASVYTRLGDIERALKLRQNALTLLQGSRSVSEQDVATELNNIGMLYLESSKSKLAIPYFQRALVIREAQLRAGHPHIAYSLAGLASAYMDSGEYALATTANDRVSQIYENNFPEDHPRRIVHLHNLGYAHMRAGELTLAIDVSHKVLALASASPTNNADMLWKSQNGLSFLYETANQYQLAILWGKEAVNTIQHLRTGLSSLDKDLQSSFLANKRHVYQHLADLLIEQGRLAEAQTVLQMLKEQELHDSLERSANTDPRSTRIELTGLERKRFAKYYELRDQQLELGLERERLEHKNKIGEISAAEKRRLEEINSRLLPPLRAAMVAFLDALQKSASELAKQEQRRADPDLKLVETNLQRAMQQAQRSAAGTATAALQFVVTDTRLSILLSTPGAPPLARQIEVSAKALRQKVMAARELVSRPPGKLPAASNPEFLNKPLRELYALLIAPIEADLQSLGVKTLILVPNDVLRYVPFAALMNGDRYLVQDYTLALFNEAVKRDFAPKVSTIWRPAAMGLTRAVANLPALPAVREEVEVVALKAGMTGKAFLDDDFNRATLTKVLGQDFNVLHLASHFDLVPGRPDASRLFLGDLSALTLGDIARDNLRFDRFSLVAFSACETGLGDTELADGRDMESLGALVQNQGAQAVIATLWKADDKSAATLMELFYRGRSMAGLSKAEALRKAQLQFVAGHAAGRARSHPYFWAPFVLMGDWR